MRKQVQTGSKKGTYSFGDPHPTVEDRFFDGYRKFPDGSPKENWMSLETLNKKRARNKAYGDANRDKTRARSRKHYRQNKEEISEYHRQRYIKDKETILARCAEYRENNRGRYANHTRKRRGQIKKMFSELSEQHQLKIEHFYKAALRVSKCIGVSFHVDHIEPLSKGGAHCPFNLQIVPAKWNLSKSNSNDAIFPHNTSPA